MSFDWKDFIKLAEELIGRQDEASLRSGISRAYYGIFCLARNQMGLKDYKKADVHKKVIFQYNQSISDEEKYVGKILDDLRKQRNDADYNEEKKIDVQLAQRVLIKAKNVLEKWGIKI